MLALCLLPTLLNDIGGRLWGIVAPGVHFGTPSPRFAGMEWCRVRLWLGPPSIGFTTERFANRFPLFVGFSLLVAALFGGLHTLAAVGLYGEGIAPEDLLPFTGAFALVMSSGARFDRTGGLPGATVEANGCQGCRLDDNHRQCGAS